MTPTTPALPPGPFDILYADPPWKYHHGSTFLKQGMHNGVVATSNVEWHYDTMTKKDLEELPVADIAAPDSLLFMWTSSPHLDQAILLGNKWGFDYKTLAFVWDKQRPNPGYYTMSQVEVCLVMKRGKIPQPRGARNVRQFLSELRGKHSEKPQEIRRRIEEMFPTQRKVELFARDGFEGWTVWGNEAPTETNEAAA